MILWLVVVGLAIWLSGSLYLVSYANMWAQNEEPKDPAKLRAEEKSLLGEIDFQEKFGSKAMDKVRALKRLAFFYLEGKNFAGARDTFLKAERVLCRDGDTAVNNSERLVLKRLAAMSMAGCTMFEEAQPLFNQADRLARHLALQQKDSSLAQAQLLNDEGVYYFLWAGATKSLHKRKAKYDQAQSFFERALKCLAGSESQDMEETLKANLEQVKREKLFTNFG